ncbi:MAG: citrate/2-methylcitrate synthase [Spirochaetia bacterium]|jgi:hypothetical protein
MKPVKESLLQSYLAHYNTITTSLGGIVEGKIRFCGLDVTNELTGNFTQTETLLLWALGRRPTEMETRLMDALIVLNIYPDLRIWSIRVGAYASAAGAPLSSCFGASHTVANSQIFGVGAAVNCMNFLKRLFNDTKSKPVEEVVMDYLSRKVFFAGFGRPLIQGNDERYIRIFELLDEWRYPLGPYVEMLLKIVPIIKKEKGLYPNYGSIFVALLLDPPFGFDEAKIIVCTHFIMNLPSYLPACEIHEKNQDSPLLPLKVSDILYTGKGKREL